MKILIAGDVHAKFSRFGSLVVKSMDLGCKAVIQVGDFGFWGSYMNDVTMDFPIPVYAIDGNHEDHKWLYKQDKTKWEEGNLFYMPRGSVKTFGSSTVAFVGGAMHVDRKQHGSIDKCTTNYLLDKEEKEIAKKLNSTCKPVDLMVAHSCPHSIGVGMMGHPMFIPMIREYIVEALGKSQGHITDCGEQVLLELWNDLEHKPLNWAYGHFHTRLIRKVENTTFACVGCCDGSDKLPYIMPFVYDTEEKEIYYLKGEKL